jgi:hypothetical protein
MNRTANYTILFALSAVLLAACTVNTGGSPAADATPTKPAAAAPATEPAKTTAAAPTNLGPTTYDASGTMPCSAGKASFDQACGWRVVRNGAGGAEIWISNIASKEILNYRVITFANGEFTAQDGSALQVSKEEDMWTVIADDGGHFRFADAVISGG